VEHYTTGGRRMGKITTVIVTLMLLAGLGGLAAGCTVGTVVTGSGNVLTREMEYRDFNKLEVSHAFEAEISRADSFSVTISADDNIMEFLDVRQRGDTLQIGLKPGYAYVSTTQRATVTMPELRSLELSGASRGKMNGFGSAQPLSLDISGASSLELNDISAGDSEFNVSGASKVSGSIQIQNTELEVSGASGVDLNGSAEDIIAEASGASTMELSDFGVNNAEVELSGASRATVNVSGQLDIDLSGASKLSYSGSPTLGKVTVSGGSTLSQK